MIQAAQSILPRASGSIDLDPILVLPAATVISVYRDAPVQPTDDEANVETPLTARRRYIGQVRIPLAGNGLPMIHSFQVTRRYVILVLCSLRVEPHLIGSKLFVLQEPFAGVQTLGWRGHQNTTVYVMDVESTDPTTGDRSMRVWKVTSSLAMVYFVSLANPSS